MLFLPTYSMMRIISQITTQWNYNMHDSMYAGSDMQTTELTLCTRFLLPREIRIRSDKSIVSLEMRVYNNMNMKWDSFRAENITLL